MIFKTGLTNTVFSGVGMLHSKLACNKFAFVLPHKCASRAHATVWHLVRTFEATLISFFSETSGLRGPAAEQV